MTYSADRDRAWVAGRRARAEAYLGGTCARCDSTEGLQFDHIDPKVKAFGISGNLNRRWEYLKSELDKCQLLCRPHHLQKSIENGELQGGQNRWTEIQHGKTWAYFGYGCRCDACREVAAQHRRKYPKSERPTVPA